MYHIQTVRLVFVLLLALIIARVVKADGELVVVKPPMDPFPKFMSDLTVTDISRPVASGSSYVVYVTVRNIGRGMAYPSYLLLRDNYANSGKMQLVDSLPGGQSRTLRFLISGPEDQTNCYLSAIADYGNKVREVNETNNVKNYYGPW